MMKLKGDRSKEKRSLLLQIIANTCIVLLMTIMPLYLENGYYNFIEAKMHVFLMIGAVVFLLFLISVLFEKDKDVLGILGNIKNKDWKTISILIFGIVSLLGTVLANNALFSFFGVKGWGVGSLEIALLIFFFLLIRRYGNPSPKLISIIFLVHIWILVIAYFQYAYINFLKIHRDYIAYYYYDYATTLGQKNTISGFLSIMIPFALISYLSYEKWTIHKVIAFIYSFMGIGIAALCGSDSIFFAIIFALFFGVSFFVDDARRVKEILIYAICSGVLILTITILPCYKDALDVNTGVGRMMWNPILGIGLIIGSLFGLLILKYHPIQNNTKKKLFVLIFRIVLAIVFSLVVISFIYNYDDEWGSKRGLIWRYAINGYLCFPWYSKIIGAGPGMVYHVFLDLSNVYGQNVFSAHNSLLQMLLTHGAIGVIFLVSWIFFVVKKFQNNSTGLIYLIPVAAYFGHMILNSSMLMNLTIVIIFLALAFRETRFN